MTNFDDFFVVPMLSRDFEEVFQKFLGGSSGRSYTPGGYPVCDIFSKEDDTTVIEMALAGFTKDDITISVKEDRGLITIEGKGESAKQPLLPNRRIAKRAFKQEYKDAAGKLDLTKTLAKFENGLLTLTIPPKAKIEPQKIDIL